ncbi:MAG TPA: hypothetical protein VFM05_09405 [Candidatus Saccharimonadales bacterium]|nr:hypothetical protein [Candidatus Saccharimonadales bacterium]
MSELQSSMPCGHHLHVEVLLAPPHRAYTIVQLAKLAMGKLEVRLCANGCFTDQSHAASVYALANADPEEDRDARLQLLRDAYACQNQGGYVVGLVSYDYPGCAVAQADAFMEHVDALMWRLN